MYASNMSTQARLGVDSGFLSCSTKVRKVNRPAMELGCMRSACFPIKISDQRFAIHFDRARREDRTRTSYLGLLRACITVYDPRLSLLRMAKCCSPKLQLLEDLSVVSCYIRSSDLTRLPSQFSVEIDSLSEHCHASPTPRGWNHD